MKEKAKRSTILMLGGTISLLIALAVAVLLFSLRYENLWKWYEDVRRILLDSEAKILGIDTAWKFVLVIFLLFALKAFVPIYPTSTVCFLTGVILPIYIAIPINIVGFIMVLSIKYHWGHKLGASSAWYLIGKFDVLKRLLKSDGKGSPVLLVSLRLIPFMPINTISSLYGSMDFGMQKFLILSMAGVMPRLISFTIVGRNLFDPFSTGFLLPIMMIAFITGIACLSVNGIWNLVTKITLEYRIKHRAPVYFSGARRNVMVKNDELREKLSAGEYDEAMLRVYSSNQLEKQKERYNRISCEFDEIYGEGREVAVYSAPGRTEVGGNHTDHNHGQVLAAGVDIDAVAFASLNDDGIVRIKSEGYNMDIVDLSDLEVKENETGHSASLVRGVCAAFRDRGYLVGGFDAATASDVISGSGLSSSAAFEVLVGTILNYMFNDGKISPVEIAQIAQYAENVYFGKPCGLMDQMACSVGGFVQIDFKDPSKPEINKVDFDFASCGHSLCIIDSGADHSDLTDDYAAVRGEMEAAAGVFGKKVLREVTKDEFLANISEVRKQVNDRAVLRSIHFFGENERVDKLVSALNANDFESFKRTIVESGHSSFMYNQNVYTCKAPTSQAVSLALIMCDEILGDKGAYRVHGGGFAGTIQAFVPDDILPDFIEKMSKVFGENACYVLNIRPVGGAQII